MKRKSLKAGENPLKDRQYLAFAIFLFLLLTLPKLDRVFTTDEIFNIHFGEKVPYSQIIPEMVKFDSHPPLVYFLHKAYGSIFGFSEVAMHSLSLLFAVLAIIAFYSLLDSVFPKKDKLIPLLLFALSPIFIADAIFVRYYSFFYFLTTLFFLLLLRFKRSGDRKNLYWLSVITALMLYTNYTALIIIGSAILTLIMAEWVFKWRMGPGNTKLLLTSLFVGASTFVFWLPIFVSTFLKQSGTYITSSFDLGKIAAYFTFNQLIGPTVFPGKLFYVVPALIFLGALILFSLFKIFKHRAKEPVMAYLAINALIIFSLLIYKKISMPIHILFFNLFVVLLLSYALFEFGDQRKRFAIFLFIALLWSHPLYNYLANQEYHIGNASDDWKSSFSFIEHNKDCQVILVDVQTITQFYLERKKIPFQSMSNLSDVDELNVSDGCVILEKSYFGAWQEGPVIFEAARKKIESTHSLRERLLLSRDKDYVEKGKLLSGSIVSEEFRITLLRYERK